MSLTLMIMTYIVGGGGIYLCFGRMESGSGYMELLALSTVGIVGVLSFVRHVIFHRSDARRMGWETDRPDWMFEVGFANLAFGFMGLLGPLGHWGERALVLIVLGYAVYLFQAAGLHFYRVLTDTPLHGPALEGGPGCALFGVHGLACAGRTVFRFPGIDPHGILR